MRQLISQLDGVSAPSEITVLDLPTRTTQIKFTLRGEWALGASYALQDKVSLYFCLVILIIKLLKKKKAFIIILVITVATHLSQLR